MYFTLNSACFQTFVHVVKGRQWQALVDHILLLLQHILRVISCAFDNLLAGRGRQPSQLILPQGLQNQQL
jgi:hypothetical protein